MTRNANYRCMCREWGVFEANEAQRKYDSNNELVTQVLHCSNYHVCQNKRPLREAQIKIRESEMWWLAK